MDASSVFLRLIASPWVPSGLVRALLGTLSAWQARRQLACDRQAWRGVAGASPPDGKKLYLLDGFHGGIAFWDWIVLAKGGLWQAVLWPAIGEVVVERALELGLPAVLELDGYTCQQMALRQPQALERLARAVAAGTVELVNGTYAQPFLDTLSGEAAVRQLSLGLEATQHALGAPVQAYACQEPCFTAQLPQLLAGFGFSVVLLRTHWAPFGCEPACDAPLVRWMGPDGSWVLAVPRHSWMDYATRRHVQPGAVRGNITGAHISRWEQATLRRLACRAAESGTEPCLLSKLEDLAPPHAPTPQAAALAAEPNLRLTTLRAYAQETLAGRAAEDVEAWNLADGLTLTLPWGLGADALPAAVGGAEAALLAAERADALAWALGAESQEARLRGAWEQLLLAQHHDLQVCGPWLSRRHGKPMSEVGCDLCAQAAATAGSVVREALGGLLTRVDATWCQGRAALVFNPEAKPRPAVVRLPARGHVFDGERFLAAQADGDDTVFVCDLPALGWRLFDLREGPLPSSEPAGVPAPFHNLLYDAEVGSDGTLTVRMGGQAVVERGANLSAWCAGEWWDSRAGVQDVQQVGQGPVFTRWLVRGTLGPLPFLQEVTLWHLLPRIDVAVRIDFGAGVPFGPQPEDGDGYYADDARKLCACFATGPGQVLRGAPFVAARTGLAQFGGVGWVGVERDGAGLALADRGARGYAYDPTAGLLRRVLAWSPRGYMYASADSVRAGQAPWTIMRGPHTFRYALLPYCRRLEAIAEALALPPLVALGRPVAGDRPGLGSLLAVQPEAAQLSAFWVRGGSAYARLWNASEAALKAEFSTVAEVGIEAVDLQLRGGEPLAARRVPLRPWGVQTVRLSGLGLLR